jgi:glycerol-3-phosphate acyltransferase PlsX
MAIVLDAMGSDNYPDPEIQAAINATQLFNEEIILVGKKELLEPKLMAAAPNNAMIRIVDAPDVLEMGEKPVEAARKKPRNSMAVGLELVKTGEAQAFVTAGNTGGAMFNALRKLGRLEGVLRPALSAIFPVENGKCVVLDIGANAECRPDYLQQFAIMGSIYAEKILSKSNARVGLLSNGEEAGKGNDLVKETFKLLEKTDINFIGNVEGKELYGGEADVVVTDGFTGNVLLKSSEAVASLLLKSLKKGLMSSLRTKIGALLAKPAFNDVRKMMDPSDIGAAPLLGIDGLVFVGHGRSDAAALTSALRVAHQAIELNLLEAMRTAVNERLSSIETDA